MKSSFRISNVFVILLTFIVVVGLLSNLFNLITNGSGAFTFRHFLDIVNNFESILPSFTIQQFAINADWGLFNFLKSIIEFMGNIISILAFLALNLLNVLKFFLHFVTSLFFV